MVDSKELAPTAQRSLDRSMAHAVAWNAGGKLIVQIVSWASTIVVARLLSPYDYGLIGMAGLYLALATLMGQTGVGNTIIALRDLTDRQIKELNTISVLLGTGLVALSCIVAVPIARFFSAPPLRGVVLVASITFFIGAFQVVPRALLQKELRFKLLSSLDTLRFFCQAAFTVILAWLHFRYWSLVLSHVLGTLISTVLTVYFKRCAFEMPHFPQLRRELRYVRHILFSGFASYVYDNADFGVAGRVLGEVPLGNYTMAWTIASTPVEKITTLFTGVTPAYFSAVQFDKAQLRRYLLRLTEALSFVTIPASLGLALVADSLVPVVLGPKWIGAIGPLRLLGLFIAVRSLAALLPHILTAIGDARYAMWNTILAAVVLPITFFIGSRWGVNGIAAGWVIVYPPIMMPMYYRVFRRTDTTPREYVSAILPALSASLIMAVVILLARSVLPSGSNATLTLSLTVFIGVLAYAGALLILHRPRVDSLVRNLKNIAEHKPPD